MSFEPKLTFTLSWANNNWVLITLKKYLVNFQFIQCFFFICSHLRVVKLMVVEIWVSSGPLNFSKSQHIEKTTSLSCAHDQSFSASQRAVWDLVCVLSALFLAHSQLRRPLFLPQHARSAAKFDIFPMAAHVGHMVHVRWLHLLGKYNDFQ